MEDVDIFAPVRDHYEIKYDGQWIYLRGKLNWGIKIADMDLARIMCYNVDECLANEGEWIRTQPKWEERSETK